MQRPKFKFLYILVFISFLAGVSESQELLEARDRSCLDEAPEQTSVMFRGTDVPQLCQDVTATLQQPGFRIQLPGPPVTNVCALTIRRECGEHVSNESLVYAQLTAAGCTQLQECVLRAVSDEAKIPLSE